VLISLMQVVHCGVRARGGEGTRNWEWGGRGIVRIWGRNGIISRHGSDERGDERDLAGGQEGGNARKTKLMSKAREQIQAGNFASGIEEVGGNACRDARSKVLGRPEVRVASWSRRERFWPDQSSPAQDEAREIDRPAANGAQSRRSGNRHRRHKSRSRKPGGRSSSYGAAAVRLADGTRRVPASAPVIVSS
jgi:hypothetical protein